MRLGCTYRRQINTIPFLPSQTRRSVHSTWYLRSVQSPHIIHNQNWFAVIKTERSESPPQWEDGKVKRTGWASRTSLLITPMSFRSMCSLNATDLLILIPPFRMSNLFKWTQRMFGGSAIVNCFCAATALSQLLHLNPSDFGRTSILEDQISQLPKHLDFGQSYLQKLVRASSTDEAKDDKSKFKSKNDSRVFETLPHSVHRTWDNIRPPKSW